MKFHLHFFKLKALYPKQLGSDQKFISSSFKNPPMKSFIRPTKKIVPSIVVSHLGDTLIL